MRRRHATGATQRSLWKRICLHGGIDTQHLLPHGSPDQVAAETRRIAAILGHGGGAIIAPCHVVQMDVPTANLEAMRDAVLRHSSKKSSLAPLQES